jgi:tetratricopeptide (TPR) repeat protein
LVALAGACLAPEFADRPRHAEEVADAVATYQARVQERLLQAELDRARATEERKQRKLALALAAALLLLVLAGGVGTWLLQQQRADAVARQEEAESRAHDRMQQARALLESAWQTADLARLADARAQADQAVEIAANAGDVIQREARRLQEEIQNRISAAQKNRALLAALLDVENMRERKTYIEGEGGRMVLAPSSTDEQFASAFRHWNAGLDLDHTLMGKVIALLQAQPEPVVQEVVAGLDEWALERRRNKRPDPEWRRLLQVAERLDKNDRRKELRQLLAASPHERTPVTAAQWDKVRAELRQLAAKVDAAREPVLGVLSLARVLQAFQEERTAERLLRFAVAVHRNDALLLFTLGKLMEQGKPPRLAEAIECYRAACALRPQLGVALGLALVKAKREDEGETVLRDMVLHEPNNPEILSSLGYAWALQKKFDQAAAAYRKAVELDPRDVPSHYNLGLMLAGQGDFKGAIASYTEALKLDPRHVPACYALGNALRARGDLKGAIDSYTKAIELDPKYAPVHNNLGIALHARKDVAGAIDCFQKAVEIDPKYAEAYYNLGTVLKG